MLGCGDGTELHQLAALGFGDATGVTFHGEEHEKRVPGGGDMVDCDGHDLRLPDGFFDATYSKEYLEHLLAPFVGLHEIARVTKPGGRFCHFISVGLEKQREPYHFSCFPAYIWVDLFHKAGLVVESWRKVSIYGDTEIQIVLEGHCAGARSLDVSSGRFDLRGFYNSTERPTMTLMEGPRPK